MKNKNTLDRRLCVAPMMDWTDRHCRYFLRTRTRRLSVTETVTVEALIHGDLNRLLGYNAVESPLGPARW